VVGQPFNDAYCAATFAAQGLLESLAPVAAGFGVHVAVVEPGAVASSFVDNAVDSLATLGGAGVPYAGAFAAYRVRTAGAFDAAQDPRDVAAVIVRAATEDRPRFRYLTSEAAVAFTALKLSDPDGSRVIGATTGWLR
jgi:NAD(P)-dependent dehydrogenase (short-subunit alcohol dehydrogenase family)